MRCKGEQPSCSRCTARGTTCTYQLSPTLSYTHRLEARIQELESALKVAQASQVQAILPNQLLSSENDLIKSLERGSTAYQNSTSFFQTAALSPALPPPVPTTSDEVESRKQRLVQNAWEQRSLEVLAETPEPFSYMLSNHWCWIQPLFNFIYRPAFTRDMSVLGPYYSHTLLNAILAHSTRWCRQEPTIRALLESYDGGKLFSRHARALLFEGLPMTGGTIPEVQTLLMLSAQECGAGKRTQAWLYSGMAFRLIQDMGLCVDNERYAAFSSRPLTDEDIEIRNRLFWSCYFWDKMICLYFGRSPSLQQTTISPPQVILDDSAEDENWQPHGLSYSAGAGYPPTKSHAISSFTHICSLSVILNQILLRMYDPQQPSTRFQRETFVHEQGAALISWWDNLPGFLKIETPSLRTHAPPGHIVTLNCLFQTFSILLYRPMLFDSTSSTQDATSNARYLRECISSANSIIAMYDLFCRTFTARRVILALAYSVYTAASIFLLQVQAANGVNDHAVRRLMFCIAALECVKESSPVLVHALGLLTRELRATGVSLETIRPLVIDHIPSIFTPDSQNVQDEDAPGVIPSSQQNSQGLEDFDFSDIEIEPSIFDAFSLLEPISVNVGALDIPEGYHHV